MTTYVLRDGKLIERHLAPPLVFGARSDLPTPMIIRDGLDDVVNPIDGKPYSSKSAYYRTVRQAGCEIAGNDPAIMKPSAPERLKVRPSVEAAYRRVANGYKPAPIPTESISATETGVTWD